MTSFSDNRIFWFLCLGVNITESATDALVNIRHFLLESARDCIDKHCHEVTAAPASASTLVSNDSVAHWQSLSILASVLVTGQSSETKPSDKGDKLVSNSGIGPLFVNAVSRWQLVSSLT